MVNCSTGPLVAQLLFWCMDLSHKFYLVQPIVQVTSVKTTIAYWYNKCTSVYHAALMTVLSQISPFTGTVPACRDFCMNPYFTVFTTEIFSTEYYIRTKQLYPNKTILFQRNKLLYPNRTIYPNTIFLKMASVKWNLPLLQNSWCLVKQYYINTFV